MLLPLIPDGIQDFESELHAALIPARSPAGFYIRSRVRDAPILILWLYLR